MSDNNFRLGYYATGTYSYTCSECGSVVTGDKRATSCLPCAAKQLQARIARLEKEIFTYNEELSDAWSKNLQDKARIDELEKEVQALQGSGVIFQVDHISQLGRKEV